MNSILHNCSHSKSDNFEKISDDKLYCAIFTYIETIFDVIKPKNVFYLAVDGVAPRAKMNQQRSRRFRSSYENELNLKKALKEGKKINLENVFDSNAITSGTIFMSRLSENLKYFIHKKISNDSNWRNVEVIFSGHEVPGEGEHKIMEFIKTLRSVKNYNKDTRHCIYGLDADLIILGLTTHDPHFAILRDEVYFGNSKKNTNNDLLNPKYHLLHLSLLREYIDLEFRSLDSELTFSYDFERILDDFILILYVIGNDFLPNLPEIHINKGAFPTLIKVFKKTLIGIDGYINENGIINLQRLKVWFQNLGEFESEFFEKQSVDLEWINEKLDDVSISKSKSNNLESLNFINIKKNIFHNIKNWLQSLLALNKNDLDSIRMHLNSCLMVFDDTDLKNKDFFKNYIHSLEVLKLDQISDDIFEIYLKNDVPQLYSKDFSLNKYLRKLNKIIEQSSLDIENNSQLKNSLETSKNIYDKKFLNWKDDYYKKKLNFSVNDNEKLTELCRCYVDGLQWVLEYYYKGCPSWSWFYKYHYLPRISDVNLGIDFYIKKGSKIFFKKSQPFKPFEQLMAVLPSRSKKLVPEIYWSLMTDSKSPIIDYYPNEVDIDYNGKTASWEAVVLLDFVNEKKLINALKIFEDKLTVEEKKRNTHGKPLIFNYDSNSGKNYKSTLPNHFDDLLDNKCIESEFTLPKVTQFKYGLFKDAKTGINQLFGFPTLKTLPFLSELRYNEIKIFNMSSKTDSVVLEFKETIKIDNVIDFSKQFLNKFVYFNYPYLKECKIVKILTSDNSFILRKGANNSKNVLTFPLTLEDKKKFQNTVSFLITNYEKTKGICLNTINVLVYVQPVIGLIRNEKGAYVKTLSKDVETYPSQLIVKNVINKNRNLLTRSPIPIDQEYPLYSEAIFLGQMFYGVPTSIIGYCENNSNLDIKLTIVHSSIEKEIENFILNQKKNTVEYYPSFEISSKLKLKPLLLSKITSSFYIKNDLDSNKLINIGLDLKFESKKEKAMDYTRKSTTNRCWEYSKHSIDLIAYYIKEFPVLISNLNSKKSYENIKLTDISTLEEINKLTSWLKKLKPKLVYVSIDHDSFPKSTFKDLENFLISFDNEKDIVNHKYLKKVSKECVLTPKNSHHLLCNQNFKLGDRVSYTKDHGKVLFSSKATVVSISKTKNNCFLGLIFDKTSISLTNLNDNLTSNRGLILDSSLVINLTNKQFVYSEKKLFS